MTLKDLHLLTWVTQLGLTVAVPPVGFIWLAVWLQNRFQLRQWVLWLGIFMGLYCAIYGLYTSLKSLKRLTSGKKKEAPTVAFNDHF